MMLETDTLSVQNYPKIELFDIKVGSDPLDDHSLPLYYLNNARCGTINPHEDCPYRDGTPYYERFGVLEINNDSNMSILLLQLCGKSTACNSCPLLEHYNQNHDNMVLPAQQKLAVMKAQFASNMDYVYESKRQDFTEVWNLIKQGKLANAAGLYLSRTWHQYSYEELLMAQKKVIQNFQRKLKFIQKDPSNQTS